MSSAMATFGKWVWLLAAGALVVGSRVALAQADFLDATFGQAGIGHVAVLAPPTARSAYVVSGSKILLVGTCGGGAGPGPVRSCLVRLDQAGQPDPGFGASGVSTPPNDGLNDYAFDAHEFPDGSYLVSGSRQIHSNGHAAVLYRFLANGERDPSFGTGGRLANPYNASIKLETYRLVVGPAGHIYLAGGNQLLPSAHYQPAIARMLSDGSADPTWAGTGVAIAEFAPAQNNQWTSIKLLGDGKILVVGSVAPNATAPGAVLVSRYQQNGMVDVSFGDAGVTRIDWTNGGLGSAGGQGIFDFIVDESGRIWLVGSAAGEISGQFVGVVTRLLPDGAADPAFGTTGTRRYTLASGSTRFNNILRMAGKSYLAGALTNADPGMTGPVVLRVTDAGEMDPSFGADGRITLPNLGLGSPLGLARQASSGRLVVMFVRQTLNGGNAYAAARLDEAVLETAPPTPVPGALPLSLCLLSAIVLLSGAGRLISSRQTS